MNDPRKPLGGRAYGSIPHLASSRLDPADHHCHAGQEAICTEHLRDQHDEVIVTEKLDGSCCAIANVDGQILALTRAGYLARTSPYKQHQIFADWVDEQTRLKRWPSLAPGQRLVGEWLAQVHGTFYTTDDIQLPFVVFDLIIGKKRAPYDFMKAVAGACDITTVQLLHRGYSVSVEKIRTSLDSLNRDYEGAVWRVERRGEYDFLAKWVRPDKQDGQYLPEVSRRPYIYWNWRLDAPYAAIEPFPLNDAPIATDQPATAESNVVAYCSFKISADQLLQLTQAQKRAHQLSEALAQIQGITRASHAGQERAYTALSKIDSIAAAALAPPAPAELSGGQADEEEAA